jgi:outer membrane protein assembly factor BamB
VELWRRHVSGTLDVPPLVDADGNVIALTNAPELVKLAPDARELWRARLGLAGAVSAPTLLSDGTIAVIAATGVAWGFTPGGAVRFSTPLGIARRDADTVPLALEDGGLLVAAGNVVVELDADGVVRARGTLDDRAVPGAGTERAAGAVVDSPGGALITTATGNVYRFRPPAAPRKIGSLGGTPSRGAMLLDDRTLVAVVDGRRVVALDLPTGTTHVRASGMVFDAPPVLGPGGLLLVGTQLGVLIGLDALGNEKVRVMLDKAPSGPAGPSGTFLGGGELRQSPPIVIDPAGRIAFLRAGGRVGVVTPDGQVEVAAERVCPGPVSLVPAGDKRMLIACRDGGLWMYGE